MLPRMLMTESGTSWPAFLLMSSSRLLKGRTRTETLTLEPPSALLLLLLGEDGLLVLVVPAATAGVVGDDGAAADIRFYLVFLFKSLAICFF